METEDAVASLSALAQTHRLEVFRRLMSAGPDGLPAGELAAELSIAPNTLSSHLKILTHSGLVRARRVGRSIIYSVNFSGMQGLMSFLLRDCCQGRPEICEPLLSTAGQAACSPPHLPPDSLGGQPEKQKTHD
ncbi:ArsR/SmtB family transcription factor [Fodinicurvata fenggangensis]|uniref:ArsR/SmtB family transcription factor n=1 Tax=Fodinicurvata fenggangensis TaxID=1121830 RepID=UPI00068F1771|nr:metalloregulator ArsR/SmtB family transcription factor [Fodinicurvata fenggangensis]